MSDVNFIGDSMTSRLGALSDFFGAVASGYVNTGVGGDSSTNVLARVGADVNGAVTPRCVVLVGFNDIHGDGAGQGGSREDVVPPGTPANGFHSVADYIRQIVANLTGRSIQAYVGTVLPVCSWVTADLGIDGIVSATTLNDRIRTLNTWLIANAVTYGYTIIDYYTSFVAADTFGKPGLFGSDGYHPSPNGSGVLTATAGPVLNGGTEWWTRDTIARDFPPTSGETVVGFQGLSGGIVTPRNWTLRVGSGGTPPYTGTGMTDAQIDACARSQMGI